MAEGLKTEMDPRVLDNGLYPQMVIESPGRRRAWRESLQDGARAFSRSDWSRKTGKNDIPRKGVRGIGTMALIWVAAGQAILFAGLLK